jgi:hypothetical protein
MDTQKIADIKSLIEGHELFLASQAENIKFANPDAPIMRHYEKVAKSHRLHVEALKLLLSQTESENPVVTPLIKPDYPNCNQKLYMSGKSYPRTCEVCKLGPCKAGDPLLDHPVFQNAKAF